MELKSETVSGRFQVSSASLCAVAVGGVVKLCLAELNEETRWSERKEFWSRFRRKKA